MRLLNLNHLYTTILSLVDMKVSNITIKSQSTNGDISFNDRVLKLNQNGWTLVHRGEALFDPINNFKQAQQLFSIFLQLEEEDDNLYVSMFYDEKDPDERTRIFMRTNLGNYASQYYYNTSLGYLELIMILSGISPDNLRDFDRAPSLDEKPKRKRTIFPQRELIN